MFNEHFLKLYHLAINRFTSVASSWKESITVYFLILIHFLVLQTLLHWENVTGKCNFHFSNSRRMNGRHGMAMGHVACLYFKSLYYSIVWIGYYFSGNTFFFSLAFISDNRFLPQVVNAHLLHACLPCFLSLYNFFTSHLSRVANVKMVIISAPMIYSVKKYFYFRIFIFKKGCSKINYFRKYYIII